MKWFNDPRTLEELKRQYRDLTKKHHPDLGGNAEDMKAINNEYDKLFARLKNVHEGQDGKSYHSKQENHERPEHFRAIIEQLVKSGVLKKEDVKIEIIGSWLWASGNTIPVKENLKAIGFRWGAAKRAWYWNDGNYRKISRRRFTMDELRNMYGSETIGGEEEQERKFYIA